MAQFDWLLMGHDFPVLPTGNKQFLLPYEASTRAKTFQTLKTRLKVVQNEQNEEKYPKNTEKACKEILNEVLLAYKMEI